jgi:hypothetical protein
MIVVIPVLALFHGPKGSLGSAWKRWQPLPISVASTQSLSARQYAQQSLEQRPIEPFPAESSHFCGSEYGCEPGYGTDAQLEKLSVPPPLLLCKANSHLSDSGRVPPSGPALPSALKVGAQLYQGGMK